MKCTYESAAQLSVGIGKFSILLITLHSSAERKKRSIESSVAALSDLKAHQLSFLCYTMPVLLLICPLRVYWFVSRDLSRTLAGPNVNTVIRMMTI